MTPQPPSEPDTPRTDKLRDMINCDCLSDDISTWLDFARQLERELNDLNVAVYNYKKIVDILTADKERLLAWLESDES